MALSKRLRFEILRRDNHTCRYCGESAPDVSLTVDHVVPVTLGGADTPDNLVAACRDCNAGKSSVQPGAEMVADVAADAMRWAAALREAGRMFSAQRDRRDRLRDDFLAAWSGWACGPPDNRQELPMPNDWPASIDQFGAAGLIDEDIYEAVDIAMRKKNVDPGDMFRYFCGVCWRMAAQKQEIARQLLAAEET